MKSCHQQPGAAAIAAVSAAVAILSHRPSRVPPRESHRIADDSAHPRGKSTQIMATAVIQNMPWQQYLQKSTLSSWRWNPPPPWFVSSTKCESRLNIESVSDTKLNDKSADTYSAIDGTKKSKIDYYYMKIDPNDVERTSLLDSHAVFGALCGDGMIERYNVYRRVNLEEKQQQSPSTRELTVVDLKLGSRLNGHGGIVHGGIISLLFDEAMGWAYECLEEQDDRNEDSSTTAVTANLTVDFRAPFLEDSEAVVRVYHDETNGRKIYFSATLESKDGSVVFAEAKSLFILVRSDRLNS